MNWTDSCICMLCVCVENTNCCVNFKIKCLYILSECISHKTYSMPFSQMFSVIKSYVNNKSLLPETCFVFHGASDGTTSWCLNRSPNGKAILKLKLTENETETKKNFLGGTAPQTPPFVGGTSPHTPLVRPPLNSISQQSHVWQHNTFGIHTFNG